MRSAPEVKMSSVILTHRARRQRGAALVIGLILLAVITLLAVAGMNSASLELVMAGNMQTKERAFQTAEAGIEQTMAMGEFTVPKDPKTEEHTDVQVGSASEKFSSTLTLDLDGAPQAAIWGNSWNSFSTYHFTLVSKGMSARNSETTHKQGIAKLSPFSTSVTGTGPLN
jgi:type IV pilus assembly protein PilX